MSGPKYYNLDYNFNFKVSSPEEAAAINSQLSSFHRGVRINVVNNELQFTVSDSAYSRGMTRYAIEVEINKAKQRYKENEELKRILKENKQKEKTKIKHKKESIESAFKTEKAKLEQARMRCSKIKREATVTFNTPFGTYDLSSELKKIEDTEKQIGLKQKALEDNRAECIRAYQEAEKAIDGCNSMSELDSVQRKIDSIAISEVLVSDTIDILESSIKEKALCLKNFASFLDSFYEKIKKNDLIGYLDRIKNEISAIDVFDVNAAKKIEGILTQIEREIAYLKEKEELEKQNAEIREKVSAQISALRELSDKLKPVLDSIVVEDLTTADYSKKSAETIKENEEILKRINDLEFVSGSNKGKVDAVVNELLPLKTSIKSETTLRKLQEIKARLIMLENECKKNNGIYLRFKDVFKEYESLYVKLQGFLSAEGSKMEDKEEYFPSPTELFLSNSNPEKQIEELKEKNAELTKLVKKCTQEGTFGAIATSVEQGEWGEIFKAERQKDGKPHMLYIRSDTPGAIFDVNCDDDGKVGIFPRGVILCNGKTIISTDGLKAVHSSCSWADEIHRELGSLGVSDGGGYEEMPSEVKESLYKMENYYHITSLEESVRYLQLLGFTQEKIAEILEIETGDNEEEQKRKRNNATNKAYIDKK